MKENIADTSKYTAVLSILVLSLFVQARYETTFAIIRLFDILTLFVFFYLFFSKKERGEHKLSLGFFYLFPFFIIHFLSASTVGAINFYKEFLQVIVFLAFAFILSNFTTKIDYKKIIVYLLLGSIFIMLFSIFWHFINGHWVGWKQLADTRIIFTVIALLIFSYLNMK